MQLAELVETSGAVAATRGRLEKIDRLARCLRQMEPEERELGARFLAGEVPYKLGIGYALVHEVLGAAAPAPASWLTLGEVDRRFAAMAELRGAGSGTARKEQLGALLALATEGEQRFLAGLIVGEVRQGALDGVVVEAIAKAADLDPDAVRRAYMLAGDLGPVASAALAGGSAEIGRFGLTVFRPVMPMLAQSADTAAEALAELDGPVALEHKLDGFRVQMHKDGGIVRAYSRGLNDVTDQVPELIAQIAALPARRLVLDGEAIALGPDGRPLPFQDTMKRFTTRGRSIARPPAAEQGWSTPWPEGRPEGGTPGADAPVRLAVFDALLVDDQTLLAEPARTRFAALDQLAPALAVPRLVTVDPAAATAFYEAAVAAGHEGIMAKALDAPYDAGNRGAAWLKIKRVHRLDLVVLAAEWGSGRRKGWLSNLWLGARDGATGGFVMLGKTFKGMTDEILRWQTAELLAREVGRDGHVVHVRPELVAEIAFNDVQRSPRYPAGLALRLARLVRYRDDKTAAEADTIDTVRAIAIASGVV